MLCGKRRTGSKFTLVISTIVIYFVQMAANQEKTEACVLKKSQQKVEEEVSWFGGCSLQQDLDLLYSCMAE